MAVFRVWLPDIPVAARWDLLDWNQVEIDDVPADFAGVHFVGPGPDLGPDGFEAAGFQACSGSRKHGKLHVIGASRRDYTCRGFGL